MRNKDEFYDDCVIAAVQGITSNPLMTQIINETTGQSKQHPAALTSRIAHDIATYATAHREGKNHEPN